MRRTVALHVPFAVDAFAFVLIMRTAHQHDLIGHVPSGSSPGVRMVELEKVPSSAALTGLADVLASPTIAGHDLALDLRWNVPRWVVFHSARCARYTGLSELLPFYISEQKLEGPIEDTTEIPIGDLMP